MTEIGYILAIILLLIGTGTIIILQRRENKILLSLMRAGYKMLNSGTSQEIFYHPDSPDLLFSLYGAYEQLKIREKRERTPQKERLDYDPFFAQMKTLIKGPEKPPQPGRWRDDEEDSFYKNNP